MSTSPLWHRAALLGSAWASIEIIAGSFLHNIRFPLAGTILAALGVVLLVAGRRIWDQPGLLWRAGVVCALMKSLSPSAVILGPMAGILLESLVLEAATRLLGPGLPGMLLGGALGSSLPLVQKAVGLVVTYGTDVARLYAAMVESAAALLPAAPGPLELLGMLLALSALLGMIAAVGGIRLARSSLPTERELSASPTYAYDFEAVDPAQRFSRTLLALHVLIVPAVLLAIGTLPLELAAPLVTLYVVGCLFRYRRLPRRLGRPRLWVEFALVTLLAGLFLGNLNSPAWSVAGLEAGAAMTLRAAFIIVAFSSISVELRNPTVLRWFMQRGFGEVSAALGVAFQALPAVIRILDQDRAFLRHPWRSLARVLGTAVAWVERHEGRHGPVTFLVTGERGAGKTGAVLALCQALRQRGITCGGVAAPAVFEHGTRVGYDLQDLASGAARTLCRTALPPTGIAQGPYHFLPETIAWGTRHIRSTAATVVCIDEIGPLELAGGGWSGALEGLLTDPPRVLVITVRPFLADRVREQWSLTPPHTWHAGSDDPRALAKAVADAAHGVRLEGVPALAALL